MPSARYGFNRLVGGAVAILEAESAEQAQKIAMQLPLAQAGLLDIRVIGLMPFDGFGAP